MTDGSVGRGIAISPTVFYVELMAGAYTDNQPDFSFLAPGETKLRQYWYPIQEIGPVQHATLEVAVSLARESNHPQ